MKKKMSFSMSHIFLLSKLKKNSTILMMKLLKKGLNLEKTIRLGVNTGDKI